MALRAEALIEENALLSRYVASAERHERLRVETATNPDGTRDLLLARYLKALKRRPRPEGANLEHREVRTCPHCGFHGEFLPERGGWAECPACATLA
jgi:hypothetical protein